MSLLAVVPLATCGPGESGEGPGDVRQTSDASASEGEASPQPTIESLSPSVPVAELTSTAVLLDLESLSALIERTVDLPRMSFELTVSMTLPEADSVTLLRRTGSFDDLTFSGIGTMSFESGDERVQATIGAVDSEFRVADGVFWYLNPLGEPIAWGGFELREVVRSGLSDPLGSVDADSYLALVSSATVEVVEVNTDGSGARVWTLRTRADDLLPMVAGGGPAGRIADAGGAQSGMTDVALREDPNGHVSELTVEMDEWWQQAVEHTIDGRDVRPQQLSVRFELEAFDEPLTVEPPCDEPATERDEEADIDMLVCQM